MSWIRRILRMSQCGARFGSNKDLRSFMFDWPLFMAVDTVSGNGLRGDYLEFGVFRGRSFRMMHDLFKEKLREQHYEQMQFVAFDSFEGLPETKDTFAPPQFKKGAYAASQKEFVGKVSVSVPLKKMVIVAGFYDETLTADLQKRLFSERKVAVAYVDCDIYESARPIFQFLESGLQDGSIIVMDDWFRHHGSRNHGIQRAYYEWLENQNKFIATPLCCTKRMAVMINTALG